MAWLAYSKEVLATSETVDATWIQGLGFGVWGLGLGAWGLGFGVWGLGLRVWGLTGIQDDSGSRV